MMRAKMYVSGITPVTEGGNTELVTFSAVSKREGYPEDGSDENNTFAKFTPNASASFSITNPALWDKFKLGDHFYVDFTKAPE